MTRRTCAPPKWCARCWRSDALDLASAMLDILDAIGKGFSATEIVWDSSKREWFPSRLQWRDPRWFMFDWVSGEELLVRSMKNEGPRFAVDGERARARLAFQGRRTLRRAARRHRNPADDRTAAAVQIHRPHRQGEGRTADSRRPRARRRDGRTCSRTMCSRTG